MDIDIRQTALLLFLREQSPLLHGKMLELREAIAAWLEYIPHTFPHYTRHTVSHSETIIQRVSRILFEEGDYAQPTVRISPMEAYILCAAAYLHDAGMVASDEEKARILESRTWNEWVREGAPGAKRWSEIDAFRNGKSPEDTHVRNFLADVQVRFLLAEFIRRTHHSRTQDLIQASHDSFGRFALDDPLLLRTINSVCVSHGLDKQALADRECYPERREIRGEEVNVRFLAILLRIGDLLDMSTDRACPLLLNAACPLPSDSLAHWTQYQHLKQFLTSPDHIEITAQCANQEEHRILKDWCDWLVMETSNATTLMARSARHGGWSAPISTIDSPDATIKIEPAPGANYIPSNWRFELDQDIVFRRLIEDLYTEPLSFVRELIQNSLDATRCQLYLDIADEGTTPPEFPTQATEEIRDKYPIRLKLEARTVTNPLSGESEHRQVLLIEDAGIGMDRQIIERYLLQVGRSYYTTQEFQRKFRFVPISRFGLGFLSVFAVSDHVTIDTFKPTSNSGPLRLVLTGPRNYILLEKATERRRGTRIEVRLREPLESKALTSAVSSWCRRVEFPILVNELGADTTIHAERKEQFTYEIPDPLNENARFAVRAFDVSRHGLEGELYVFTRVDERGESWDAWSEAKYDYPRRDPRASPPEFPEPLTCVQGLVIGTTGSHGPSSARIDYRGGDIPTPTLSREQARVHHGRKDARDERITSRWAEILTTHLSTSERAKSAEGWQYKQALVDGFPAQVFWASLPETIPTHRASGRCLISLNELMQLDLIATIAPLQSVHPVLGVFQDKDRSSAPVWTEQISAIFPEELRRISTAHRLEIFGCRGITQAYWLPSGHLVMLWRKNGGLGVLGGTSYRPSYLAEFPNDFTIGCQMHPTRDTSLASAVFNVKNRFTQWLVSIRDASTADTPVVSPETFERLDEMFRESCGYGYKVKELKEYIEKWKGMAGLPANLYPPEIAIVPSMFARIPPSP